MREYIKRWRWNGFRVDLWDTGTRDWRGQTRLAYRLRDRGETIFAGEDFCGSPMHADDSLDTIAALLGFLTLKPGDTDPEFFAEYTERQLDWVQSGRAGELTMWALAREERTARARRRR